MSVASRNPFDILSDAVPETPAPSSKTSNAQPAVTAAPATRGGQKGRSGPASRGGRYYQRGGGAASSAARDQPEQAEDSARDGKRNSEERERGRGRGRGGRGRGGDRGRGGQVRPFDDRHSKTSKSDTEKKVSQAWGSDEGKAELKAEEDGLKDAAADVPTNDWGNEGAAAADDAWGIPAPVETAKAADAAPAETRRNREEEEEDNTLTLDQYLARQREKSVPVVPQLESRKANDGDDALWKDAVKVVKGEEEEAYFAGKPKAFKSRPKAKEEKKIIEINAQFDRPSRGGRGGRGGDRDRGRGRGGRGRGRGEFHGANGNGSRQVDVADESAFPSLS
ncbi:hypothetical protein EW145_g3741 [Phellinidium pouzarii]|uniref:Hyaluronan/mRNA-binding protein domain-containing protein n=1 Tax=Phellinidium pouzarii TaxID=167371 RepID=A0A4S4L608_9AGAM|nr:hypothetical protein EW145_g3741 [Phellinidium pouzarii]